MTDVSALALAQSLPWVEAPRKPSLAKVGTKGPARKSRRRERDRSTLPFELAYTRLRSARTRAELRLLADGILSDRTWQRLCLRLSRRATTSKQVQRTLEAIEHGDETALPYQRMLAPNLASRCRHVLVGLFRAVLALVEQGHESHGVGAVSQVATVNPKADMIGYLTDHTMPREVRRCLYERDLAGVYWNALIGACVLNSPPRPWVVEALYEGWTEGLGAWFDLIATEFGIEVPDDLRKRVDWTDAARRHAEEQQAADLSRRAFIDGGRKPMLVVPREPVTS